MDGQQRQLALFEALWALIAQRDEDQTLILLVEDLHWIDTASEEALRYLADRLAASPVVLLLTSRPGYQNPFHQKIDVTYLALPTLTVHESLRLAENMPDTSAFSEELRELLIEKSQGNPFFLEELTRAVIEAGNLQLDMRVPDTVQGVLMARIDRLPEEPKRLLQTASVLGREFSLSLLKRLWDGTDMLEPLLVELQRQEFFDKRLSTVEPLYVFKHALTQEVAYDSLLMSHRQALHLAAGRALEALYTDRIEEAYERLSYHYANTPEADKAVEYLTRFARKATHGYALVEAITALQEALEHVDQLAPESRDRRRLDLVLRLSRALTALGRLPETLELLLREQGCLERLQEPALAGPYYFRLGHTASLMGDNERAAEGVLRALEAAIQCDDTATMSRAYYTLSMEGIYNGRCQQGISYGQQAIELLEHTGDQRWLGLANCAVGFNYAGLGEFGHGLAAFSRAYAIGEMLEDVRLQSMAAGVSGFIHTLRGDWQAGIEAGQRALDLSPDPFRTAASMAYLERVAEFLCKKIKGLYGPKTELLIYFAKRARMY
jgi:tetratricopeptide (TPR) repeat protein